jgi:antitoxin YefM
LASADVNLSAGVVVVGAFVTRIKVMTETFSLAQVKARFSEMVDRVDSTHDRITVTRNGRPSAVLLSPADLASLEDTLDLLSDPEAMAELAASQAAHDAGEYITATQLRERFLTQTSVDK